MEDHLENGAVMEKTLELCQAIVDGPQFLQMREHIDAFMADDQARQLYQDVSERSESLHAKQHRGQELTDAELGEFETSRQALVNNPVARNFLAAQEEMRRIQDSVTRYVTKTLELGRVPGPEDFESCGHGCSCGR